MLTHFFSLFSSRKKEAFDEPENDFQTEWDEYI